MILNRSDYRNSILNIINDATKFKLVKDDPTILREGKLQRYLRKLNMAGHLDDRTYTSIYPCGSQPARIYGLPKMHKLRGPNGLPKFRPIVSFIGTYSYDLAKFLCGLLTPHIPTILYLRLSHVCT